MSMEKCPLALGIEFIDAALTVKQLAGTEFR